MAVSDAVFVACIAASGTLGGVAAQFVGHLVSRRNTKDTVRVSLKTADAAEVTAEATAIKAEADAEKTSQETDVRWYEEWRKATAAYKDLWERQEELSKRVESLEGDLKRKDGELTACQRERLDLSRLATHLADDRDRWRMATKACQVVMDSYKLGRVDELLLAQALGRVEEAYRGEQPIPTIPSLEAVKLEAGIAAASAS